MRATGQPSVDMDFQRRSNAVRSARCLVIEAADQSRAPAACSMRGTSSNEKGLYSARQVQKSDANWSNGSVFACPKQSADRNNKPESVRRFMGVLRLKSAR